jgi:hypothetical protein
MHDPIEAPYAFTLRYRKRLAGERGALRELRFSPKLNILDYMFYGQVYRRRTTRRLCYFSQAAAAIRKNPDFMIE